MKSLVFALLAGSALAPSATRAQEACGQGVGADIAVANLAQGETVGYELLLVKGTLSPSADAVYLDRSGDESASAPPAAEAPKRVRQWPAGGGRFKALIHLKPGPNRLMLSAPGHRTRCLDIVYSPPAPAANRLRMVFVLAADTPEGPDVFRTAPGDSSGIASAKRRLGFGALLMESAMAELMYQAGYPRRTASFRRDSRGNVDVTVFHSRYTDAQLRAKTPDELYDVFRVELDSSLQDGRTKFVCMLGGFGSGALGGTNQAMFGTSTLYSWAQGLDEMVARFTDGRKPGEFQLEDESAFRNTFWSNYSTGIGATLHEVGHALGLRNLDEENEVMQRGFDRFNRIFMLREDGKLVTDQAVHYGPTSSDLLWRSPWVLAPAPVGLRARSLAEPRLDRIGNAVVLRLSAAEAVAVDLHSARGARLARMAAGRLSAGDHAFALPRLPPGLYFCSVRRAGNALRIPVVIP
jgi:hypothetical protein